MSQCILVEANRGSNHSLATYQHVTMYFGGSQQGKQAFFGYISTCHNVFWWKPTGEASILWLHINMSQCILVEANRGSKHSLATYQHVTMYFGGSQQGKQAFFGYISTCHNVFWWKPTGEASILWLHINMSQCILILCCCFHIFLFCEIY